MTYVSTLRSIFDFIYIKKQSVYLESEDAMDGTEGDKRIHQDSRIRFFSLAYSILYETTNYIKISWLEKVLPFISGIRRNFDAY
jgi:hypothetical protein